MTEDNKPNLSLSEILPDLPIFVRFRTARLVEEILGHWSNFPEATRSAAEVIDKAFKDGRELGQRAALYDATPENFSFAKAIHLHKVGDLRILEMEHIESDKTVYSAQIHENAWGQMHTSFDAALVDALGYKYSPEGRNDDPGYYANRVLGIPNGWRS